MDKLLNMSLDDAAKQMKKSGKNSIGKKKGSFGKKSGTTTKGKKIIVRKKGKGSGKGKKIGGGGGKTLNFQNKKQKIQTKKRDGPKKQNGGIGGGGGAKINLDMALDDLIKTKKKIIVKKGGKKAQVKKTGVKKLLVKKKNIGNKKNVSRMQKKRLVAGNRKFVLKGVPKFSQNQSSKKFWPNRYSSQVRQRFGAPRFGTSRKFGSTKTKNLGRVAIWQKQAGAAKLRSQGGKTGGGRFIVKKVFAKKQLKTFTPSTRRTGRGSFGQKGSQKGFQRGLQKGIQKGFQKGGNKKGNKKGGNNFQPQHFQPKNNMGQGKGKKGGKKGGQQANTWNASKNQQGFRKREHPFAGGNNSLAAYTAGFQAAKAQQKRPQNQSWSNNASRNNGRRAPNEHDDRWMNKNQNQRQKSGHMVKVFNMPTEFSWKEIDTAFREFYDIDRTMMKGRGTAVISFRSLSDARAAVQQFDGGEMNGHRIRVALE